MNEDIIEGTTIFILKVVLPIVESFGFSQVLILYRYLHSIISFDV